LRSPRAIRSVLLVVSVVNAQIVVIVVLVRSVVNVAIVVLVQSVLAKRIRSIMILQRTRA
jgi:hypothetical protein